MNAIAGFVLPGVELTVPMRFLRSGAGASLSNALKEPRD